MSKRVFAALLALVLCFCAAVPALAAEGKPPRLVDDADLLTTSEEMALLSKLDEISQRQQLDVVVVTVNTLEGKSPRDFADDFFDYNGYGFGSGHDGVLLLVSMEDRDWWISTTGYGITAFTDAGIEYISEQFLPSLSDGEYADAFDIFAEQCDAFITQARTGEPYDSHNLPVDWFFFVFWLMVSLVVGFLIALIVTGVMRMQLRSVRAKPLATDYVRPGSMNVVVARDIFLYRQLSRRPRPKDTGSGVHTSSSGRSHGGGGGKF